VSINKKRRRFFCYNKNRRLTERHLFLVKTILSWYLILFTHVPELFPAKVEKAAKVEKEPKAEKAPKAEKKPAAKKAAK
jgi:hypothetical protein